MSQQEFEPRPRQADDEVYRPQYPYTWSDQYKEGMPRDESPASYDTPAGQRERGQAQVPWWARPRIQPHGSFTFATILAIALFLALLTGALGIAGVVLGALAHVIGVLLGAIFVLFIFLLILIFVVLALVRRALERAIGYDRRAARRAHRMARRAARRWPW